VNGNFFRDFKIIKLFKYINNKKMKTYKFCQSCGMPMKQDLQKGGTEKDGSKNNKYCSYCYKEGEFTSPEVDTPQKIQ